MVVLHLRPGIIPGVCSQKFTKKKNRNQKKLDGTGLEFLAPLEREKTVFLRIFNTKIIFLSKNNFIEL
jgi:hypothetical protein